MEGNDGTTCCGTGAPSRLATVARALRLEWLTVSWNVAEGAIGITAAFLAGSTALLGFSIDSFVESLSGSILLWRLYAERRHDDPERVGAIERTARRLVAGSLFVLAAYVAAAALRALFTGERPDASWVGIGLTTVSLFVMVWLARAKRRAARELGSRALEADAFQTTACWWLSLVTLAGIGLNALAGWWWADPLAALAMTWLIAREGRDAWRGEACGCG